MSNLSLFMYSLAMKYLLILFFMISCVKTKNFEQMATEMGESFDAPLIYLSEFKEVLEDDSIYLIDAREENEYRVSHISGAHFISFNKFDINLIKSKIPKNKKIIV